MSIADTLASLRISHPNSERDTLVEAALAEAQEAIQKRASTTTENLHLYADGTSGSDNNDGLTPATQKRTLVAVRALIPDHIPVGVIVFVHLSGNFAETATFYLQPVGGGGRLVVCGGIGRTPVDANVYTTTSAGVDNLTDSAAPFTADEYANVEVEILTGAAAGQFRGVQGCSTTAVVPMKNFSVDPGVGATFRFVRPTTTLNCSFYINGPRDTSVQNLYWADKAPAATGFQGFIDISHCIVEASESLYAYDGYSFGLSASTRSAVDGSYVSGGTAAYGLLFRNIGSKLLMYNVKINGLQGVGCSIAKFYDVFLIAFGFNSGSRIRGVGSVVNRATGRTFGFLSNTSGYATTKINPATGVGLLMQSCDLEIDSGDVSDCGSHGLEIQHSRIDIKGALAGSGNAGAGIYAHSGSVVHIKDGTPPTITGTVGDLAISDPTAQESTWATIDGGTKVSISDEMTMAKEVA